MRRRIEATVESVSTNSAFARILPALAYAGTDNGKGDNGQNNGNQYGKGNNDPSISAVPEANHGHQQKALTSDLRPKTCRIC